MIILIVNLYMMTTNSQMSWLCNPFQSVAQMCRHGKEILFNPMQELSRALGESNLLLKKEKKESVQSNARAVEGESNLLLWSPAPPTALTPLSTFNLAIASIIVNFQIFRWSVTTHFHFCYCTVILYWYHASHLDLSKSCFNFSCFLLIYIYTSII